tara:strand:+ start:1751 stop:2251 length:501 start_codon:yes stop_codon:yes gene_type:complete
MKINIVLKIFFCLLIAIALNACGFQLRGKLPQLTNLSNPIFIHGVERYSKIYKEMERQFQIAGVKTTNTKNNSNTQIRITDYKSISRVFKMNSSNSANEFELEESFVFSVQTKKGKIVIKQMVKILRIFTTSSTDLSIRKREESKLREDMRKDLILRMIRRIKAQG